MRVRYVKKLKEASEIPKETGDAPKNTREVLKEIEVNR